MDLLIVSLPALCAGSRLILGCKNHIAGIGSSHCDIMSDACKASLGRVDDAANNTRLCQILLVTAESKQLIENRIRVRNEIVADSCANVRLEKFVGWCHGLIGFHYRETRATPNDPKLSDRGARRGLCAGEGGEGAKAVESIGRDVRSGSLQRMVRRLG